MPELAKCEPAFQHYAEFEKVMDGLSLLITTSVFFMAIAYLATSASIFALHRKGVKAQFHLGGWWIPSLGTVFSTYLITQCSFTRIALGLILLTAGVPIYVKYTPKKEAAELKEALLSRESVVRRAYSQEERFVSMRKRILPFFQIFEC